MSLVLLLLFGRRTICSSGVELAEESLHPTVLGHVIVLMIGVKKKERPGRHKRQPWKNDYDCCSQTLLLKLLGITVWYEAYKCAKYEKRMYGVLC